MSFGKDVTAILKKAGIAYTPLPKDQLGSHNLNVIFSHLTPDRICEFDPECIGGAEHYVDILSQFADATAGEFTPETIRTAGSVNNTMTVEFDYLGKAFKFKFAQEGDWVADGFYEQLKKFCKKNLAGNFLSLASEISTEVYLPHKVIAQVQKKTKRFGTTDEFLSAVLGGADPRAIGDSVAFDVLHGYTEDGETMTTALCKAIPDDDRLAYVYEWFAETGNGLLMNRHGEIPQLLRPSVVYKEKVLETFTFDEVNKWKRAWGMRAPEYMEIITALSDVIPTMHFTVDYNMWEFTFSHSTVFQYNLDVAGVHITGPAGAKVYTLFVQTVGEGGGRIFKQLDSSQKGEVVETLRRYCNNTLWN